jgi:hypothetical protein
MDARWPGCVQPMLLCPWILAVDDATPPVASVIRHRTGSRQLSRHRKTLRGSPAPTVKGARDKQSKDRQRQAKENECHEGTNYHVQHRVPLTWLFFPLHFNRALVEQKRRKSEPALTHRAFSLGALRCVGQRLYRLQPLINELAARRVLVVDISLLRL